jgi:hypothetical protein
MFRLLRVTRAARPADLFSGHNRRSEADDRWRLLAGANMKTARWREAPLKV